MSHIPEGIIDFAKLILKAFARPTRCLDRHFDDTKYLDDMDLRNRQLHCSSRKFICVSIPRYEISGATRIAVGHSLTRESAARHLR